MTKHDRPTADSATRKMQCSVRTAVQRLLLGGIVLSAIATQPALAQTSGLEFCYTDMAMTIKNIFTLIQFGGPLIGGVTALGTTVAIPVIRNADSKRELKSLRNQAIIWGLLVAPMGTAIVQFLLNNVVAGGASCAF